MHILFVADGRSPIARRWIQGVLATGHQVSLVSTYPCEPIPGVPLMAVMPVAFSGMASGPGGSGQTSRSVFNPRKAVTRFRSLFLKGRYQLGPLTLRRFGGQFARLVEQTGPDMVHALRIPFEGMLASYTPPRFPLAVTIWGNDLTLHAVQSRSMRSWTERTLRRANGLVADAHRDIRLAKAWGFPEERPTLVAPGNGGIDLAEINTPASLEGILPADIPADAPLIINPRGIRPAYARTDVFFQAVPLVLQRRPDVHFLCPAMAGQVEAQQWLERLKVADHVHLLPYLPQPQLWELFRRSQVTSSVTTHDGTPNTLLEAMALGCFPVAGDIEALREWITPGVNGLLVEPNKPQTVAEAFLLALEQPELRLRAAAINLDCIRERAEISRVRAQLEVFYQWVWGLR